MPYRPAATKPTAASELPTMIRVCFLESPEELVSEFKLVSDMLLLVVEWLRDACDTVALYILVKHVNHVERMDNSDNSDNLNNLNNQAY